MYRSGFAGQTKIIDVFGPDHRYINSFENITTASEWMDYHHYEEEWYVEEETIPDSIENVLHTVKEQIDFILESTEAYDYKIFLTDPNGTFRDEVATIQKYKGNREGATKPHHYQNIRDYLINVHKAVVTDNIEADDALGIEMMKREDAVICTLDKDLDMIPGLHYDWSKQEWNDVTHEEAMRSFYYQLLTGDSTDNIQGLPGVGAVAASAILGTSTDIQEMYNKVRDAYIAAYGGDEKEAKSALVENARLLWIMRIEDDRWSAPQEDS